MPDEPLPASSEDRAVTKRGPSLLRMARELRTAKEDKEVQALRANASENAAYLIFPWEVVEYMDDGARPLVLRRTETGCIVPVNHSPMKSGYVHISNTRFKLFSASPLLGKSEQMHRVAYRQRYGLNSIPEEGYEVHHWCRNPTCCNPDHLEALREDEHRLVTVEMNATDRVERIGMMWLSRPDIPSVAALASELEMPLATVSRRLAAFLAEQADDRERWDVLQPSKML
jgi:hypothetical protein